MEAELARKSEQVEDKLRWKIELISIKVVVFVISLMHISQTW